MQKLVAGPWGDLSQDFHALLGIFAKSRAEANSRNKGRERGAGELGKVMGEVRRAINVSGSGEKSSFVSSRETVSSGTRGKSSRGKKEGDPEN